MDIDKYLPFKVMAIVPWGFLSWTGVAVQLLGLAGLIILFRLDFGTWKFWKA